ncbi:MAG: hypothetical protein K6G12_11260 [Lachnospiraceae bacterium]|nr:hypothetical protein [Lachnospiraceae bacterium]
MKRKITLAFILMSLFISNAMTVFAQETVDVVPGEQQAVSGDYGISIGMVIIIALIVAGIACFIASSSMKSVYTATTAKRYEKEGSFGLTNKIDNHVNTTRQVIHHESRTPTQGPGGTTMQGGGRPPMQGGTRPPQMQNRPR